MKPLLTILIPTFRNPSLVRDCVCSLINYTEFPYKIVVLNNDPSPLARETLDGIFKQSKYTHLVVKHLDANKGWMGAINAGMSEVGTEYMCMLNDDVLFIPGQIDFWRRLIAWLGNGVGAVGPCSNFVMGTQALQLYGTPVVCLTRFLIGFCLVMRADVFRQVGMLDETLPGGDDIDLSMRLRAAGYGLVADKTAYLHHIGCQTGVAVHGAFWNSLTQQDMTNNALIRKHGVTNWYLTVGAAAISEVDPAEVYAQTYNAEMEWTKTRVNGSEKGLNLGCGAHRLGTWGLDLRRQGEKGQGGTKLKDADPDVTADATDLPIVSGTLDYVVANHLLEHLVDPLKALREWKRVLKPGGRLVMTLPNHDVIDSIVIDSSHVHAYTPESVRALLEVDGWKVLDVTKFPTTAFGIEAEAK